MNQTSTIAAALIAGFVVYVTVRGELPAYLCVVGFGNGCNASKAPANSTQQNTLTNPTNTNSTITNPQHGTGGNGNDNQTYVTNPNNGTLSIITSGGASCGYGSFIDASGQCVDLAQYLGGSNINGGIPDNGGIPTVTTKITFGGTL